MLSNSAAVVAAVAASVAAVVAAAVAAAVAVHPAAVDAVAAALGPDLVSHWAEHPPSCCSQHRVCAQL